MALHFTRFVQSTIRLLHINEVRGSRFFFFSVLKAAVLKLKLTRASNLTNWLVKYAKTATDDNPYCRIGENRNALGSPAVRHGTSPMDSSTL